MKQFAYLDKNGVIQFVSNTPIITNAYKQIILDLPLGVNPVGKRITSKGAEEGMRVALICNWGDECGIADYTGHLVGALRDKVDALKIFAEKRDRDIDNCDGVDVEYTWKRGESMAATIREVLAWRPTVVLIQHEFGIFPRATFFLQMLEMLENTPYAVTVHSVYEHLDKTICTSAMKNIIVHTEQGKECLLRLGNTNNIHVIIHGCIDYGEVEENWNIFHTPHSIVQFGFGFRYKGVDAALHTIAQLKEKYPDIFYCYLCSQNQHSPNIFNQYAASLKEMVKTLGLEGHAVIVQGYQSTATLNNYLRTARLAVFPYTEDPRNRVYGSSGAVRVAMANRIPTIVSSSHMFDDMEGVLPRPHTAIDLASTIDKVFSCPDYRQDILAKSQQFVGSNTWSITADRHIAYFREIASPKDQDILFC